VKGRPGMPGFRGLATRSPIEGGGEPLVPEVKRALEASFDVNLDSVRVHYDGHAHTVAETLGARAFAYGNHIFLGAGESKADLGLLAHETAHVVQQQSAAAIQLWSPAQIDTYEYEADRASSAVLRGDKFSVAGRVSKPRVQRSLLSRLLDRLANWAYNIPGFRLLTVILGKNPINWSDVDRSAANILRGLVELIPGGHLLEEALDKYGVFEKLGGWLEQQVRRMESIGSAIKADWDSFVDGLDWTDIRHPGKVWDDAVGVFTRAVQRIGRFALDVGRDILKFIKDAILMPLAKLAEGTRGWDLLIAVLGKNPITGEPVPRTAENLIGGFMKLIGQEEVWENIKKSHAIPRAWAWFQGALKGVISFVSRIPALFIDALKSLTLEDIIILPKAFIKVGKIFGGFLLDFISWAGEQVWTLLQIIFEVVAPAVMPYLKKAAAAFRTILKHPGTFVGHLVKAAKEGFHLFASHFLAHLQAALVGWLTGTLEGANIYIPQGFTFMEIIKFVLSVLGLTWQNIRAKLVKVMGETAVKALETGFDLVVTLVTQGPAAAWEKIQEGISNLKQMVIDGIMNFVKDRIVQAAVTKLLSMLSPAGAFIQAIIAIYNTVMFFIERLKQIGQVAAAFIDSISAIASGIITPAAQKVEQTLGGLLTLVVSFLARLVGLGKVSDAIKDIINKIRDPIDKALDRVVDWIVTMARKVGKGVAQAGVPQDPEARLELAAQASIGATRALAGRAVTRPLLTPLFAAVKLRYGLTSIEPFEQSGNWWVRLEINPVRTADLGLSSGAQADLGPIQRAFGQRLFTRAELEEELGSAKSTALSRINEMRDAGVLFVLASAQSDVGTQYSFDREKAGQRETSPNNRSKYGYQNPNKRSPVGLQILSKGLRPDSPKPIERTDPDYHETKARYDSWRGRQDFRFQVAILGHKDPGASGHWNRIGHTQTREDNQAWNRDPDHYAGPEHEDESSASGGSSERYRVPSKAAGSHRSWW
jgi:uncharacterized protein DUF4157